MHIKACGEAPKGGHRSFGKIAFGNFHTNPNIDVSFNIRNNLGIQFIRIIRNCETKSID